MSQCKIPMSATVLRILFQGVEISVTVSKMRPKYNWSCSNSYNNETLFRFPKTYS